MKLCAQFPQTLLGAATVGLLVVLVFGKVWRVVRIFTRSIRCCIHAGQAAVLFVQKWFETGGPLGVLFKIVILDIYKAQTPDLQPWFRETREAKFGVKLEEVQMPL